MQLTYLHADDESDNKVKKILSSISRDGKSSNRLNQQTSQEGEESKRSVHDIIDGMNKSSHVVSQGYHYLDKTTNEQKLSMRYYICDDYQFKLLMTTPNNQYLSEVLWDGPAKYRNTRFFCDADLEYTDDIDNDVVHAYVDELIGCLQDFGLIDQKYSVYSSSRPGKISLHVYSHDTWFSDLSKIRYLVKVFKQHYSEYDICKSLDLGVYRSNGASLRLPNSAKSIDSVIKRLIFTTCNTSLDNTALQIDRSYDLYDKLIETNLAKDITDVLPYYLQHDIYCNAIIQYYSISMFEVDVDKYAILNSEDKHDDTQSNLEFYIELEHGIDIWDCNDEILIYKPETSSISVSDVPNVQLAITNQRVREAIHSYNVKEIKQLGTIDKPALWTVVLSKKVASSSISCALCHHPHTGKDNNHYLLVFPNGGVLLKCRKSDGYLSLISGKRPIDKTYKKLSDDEKIQNQHKQAVNIRKKMMDRLMYDDRWGNNDVTTQVKLDLSVFLDQEMSILQSKTINVNFVSAPMGIGKTEQLMEYMISHPAVYISLTFRVSLAVDMINKFGNKGIKIIDYQSDDFHQENYSQIISEMSGSICIVVQFESLHRLEWLSEMAYPSVVIIDEYVSMIEQWSTNLQRSNKKANIDMIERLIQNSNQVICMDANLTLDYVKQIDKFIAPDGDGIRRPSRCKLLVNQVQMDKTVHIIHKPMDVISRLIMEGKKIVIMNNSATGLEKTHKLIRANYPKSKILIVTGRSTKNYEGQEHYNSIMKEVVFNDMTKYIIDNKITILMYSPVLQAGVSLILEGWDNIVAEFCDSSCSALACVQMLGRCRTATNIYLSIHDDAQKLIMIEIQAKEVLDKYISDKQPTDLIMIATNGYNKAVQNTDKHIHKLLDQRELMLDFEQYLYDLKLIGHRTNRQQISFKMQLLSMVSHYKFEYHDAPAVSIITKVDDDESLSGELMVANWKIRKALNGKITMADGHLYNVEMLWEQISRNDPDASEDVIDQRLTDGLNYNVVNSLQVIRDLETNRVNPFINNKDLQEFAANMTKSCGVPFKDMLTKGYVFSQSDIDNMIQNLDEVTSAKERGQLIQLQKILRRRIPGFTMPKLKHRQTKRSLTIVGTNYIMGVIGNDGIQVQDINPNQEYINRLIAQFYPDQ